MSNNCVIRKLVHNADINQRMKLTRKGLIEALKVLETGGTVYQASKKAGISVGYMYKLWNKYLLTKEIPFPKNNVGKPKRKITKKEVQVVRRAYSKYRICASRLTNFIKKDYNMHIPHYTVHKILLDLGFAELNGRKDVRKKTWIRYERRNSLTAVHMDWYYYDKEERWILPVIDDSSRKLLSLIECESATTEASIEAVKEALKHGEIQQCITDHGTQFWKGKDSKAKFPKFLEENGIKHIPTKIKHPQSNGKSEKFNDCYKAHRHAFKTKEEFINWYNNIKPHMSLDERTPEEVYQERKKKGRKYLT